MYVFIFIGERLLLFFNLRHVNVQKLVYDYVSRMSMLSTKIYHAYCMWVVSQYILFRVVPAAVTRTGGSSPSAELFAWVVPCRCKKDERE